MAWTNKRVARGLAERISRYALWAAHGLCDDRRLWCNCCQRHTAGFSIYEGRPYACPHCRASSRERFVLALIEECGFLEKLAVQRILHCAPSEKRLSQVFREQGEYIAADLHPEIYPGEDVRKLDLTRLDQMNWGPFDFVYASHVLEHIPDDKAALQAIWASLREGGEAWFLVPLRSGKTLEMKPGEELTPQERERTYGQWDHVRWYGSDFAQRLTCFGFRVESASVDALGLSRAIELGLNPEDRLFRCEKQP